MLSARDRPPNGPKHPARQAELCGRTQKPLEDTVALKCSVNTIKARSLGGIGHRTSTQGSRGASGHQPGARRGTISNNTKFYCTAPVKPWCGFFLYFRLNTLRSNNFIFPSSRGCQVPVTVHFFKRSFDPLKVQFQGGEWIMYKQVKLTP